MASSNHKPSWLRPVVPLVVVLAALTGCIRTAVELVSTDVTGSSTPSVAGPILEPGPRDDSSSDGYRPLPEPAGKVVVPLSVDLKQLPLSVTPGVQATTSGNRLVWSQVDSVQRAGGLLLVQGWGHRGPGPLSFTVAAYAAKDGRRRWATAMQATLRCMAADAHDVFLISDSSVVQLDAADGKQRHTLLWHGPRLRSAAVVGHQLLVLGTARYLRTESAWPTITGLAAIDSRSQPLWQRKFEPIRDASILDNQLEVSAATHTLYLTRESGEILALDAESGRTVAQWQPKDSRGAPRRGDFAALFRVLDDGRTGLWLGRYRVDCLNLPELTLRWTAPLRTRDPRPEMGQSFGAEQGVALHDGRILLAAWAEPELVALDADDGSVVWRRDLPRRVYAPAFGRVGDHLVCPLVDTGKRGTGERVPVLWLDPATGDTQAELQLPVLTANSAVVDERSVALGTEEGVFVITVE